MSYILPQVQVFQLFSQVPQNVVKNLNVFVFGPNYHLRRYSEDAERDLTYAGQYNFDSDLTVGWPNMLANSYVDEDYVKVYMEDAWVKFYTSSNSAKAVDDVSRNKLRFDSVVVADGNGVARDLALLRDIGPGDRIAYAANGISGTSRVTGLLPEMEAASIDTPANASSNAAGLVEDLSIESVGVSKMASSTVKKLDTFWTSLSDGGVNDTITITITTAGPAGTARANVVWASGYRSSSNVAIDAASGVKGALYLGRGLYVEFDGVEDNFEAGTVFEVTAVATFDALDTIGQAAGTYTGSVDTTYVLEVVRGGAFAASPSLTVEQGAGGGELAFDISDDGNWDVWTGGDTDQEFILRCITAGTDDTARFSWTDVKNVDSVHSYKLSDAFKAIGSYGINVKYVDGTFAEGDYWVVMVALNKPQVKVSDSKGTDTPRYVNVTLNEAFSLGNYGVTFKFTDDANGGLRFGDVYRIACEAAAPGAIQTLVLADAIPTGIGTTDPVSVDIFTVVNGVKLDKRRLWSAPDYNWTPEEDEITIHSGLKILVPEFANAGYLEVTKANMFVEYRALSQDYATGIHALETVSDVALMLGTVHPDNPLAQGVYNAAINSGDRTVYYMATPSDDFAGFNTVLDRATLTSDVYAFVPLTRDGTILDAVQGHINEMSTATEKHWRIAFVGTDLPTSDPIYDASTGGHFATVTADSGNSGKNTLVTFVDDGGHPAQNVEFTKDLVAGDRVRIGFTLDPWGTEIHSEYIVKQVLTNNTLRLVAGPAAAIDDPSKVEVYHPYSLVEIADAVAYKSNGFYSRRMYSVFPSLLTSNGVVQTAEFGAAAVAGLASSVPPQQPITNIEIVGFDDLPMVYQTFNRTQLNKMAEYGTLIVMQNFPGSKVYIRHQLSTKAKEGNLLESELSITRNVDSISYFFADLFEPYIGKYNITPSMLNILDNVVKGGISYLSSSTDIGLIGPQIILERTELISMEQDPLLQDHVIIELALGVPRPLNVIQLKLMV